MNTQFWKFRGEFRKIIETVGSTTNDATLILGVNFMDALPTFVEN
jgi:hypothetical protein